MLAKKSRSSVLKIAGLVNSGIMMNVLDRIYGLSALRLAYRAGRQAVD